MEGTRPPAAPTGLLKPCSRATAPREKDNRQGRRHLAQFALGLQHALLDIHQNSALPIQKGAPDAPHLAVHGCGTTNP